MKYATSVPQTFGRRVNCEAPKNTAASAGNSSPGPVLELYVPTFIEKITPARPAIVADAISDPTVNRSTLRPASRAASGLPPTAKR